MLHCQCLRRRNLIKGFCDGSTTMTCHRNRMVDSRPTPAWYSFVSRRTRWSSSIRFRSGSPRTTVSISGFSTLDPLCLSCREELLRRSTGRRTFSRPEFWPCGKVCERLTKVTRYVIFEDTLKRSTRTPCQKNLQPQHRFPCPQEFLRARR